MGGKSHGGGHGSERVSEGGISWNGKMAWKGGGRGKLRPLKRKGWGRHGGMLDENRERSLNAAAAALQTTQ